MGEANFYYFTCLNFVVQVPMAEVTEDSSGVAHVQVKFHTKQAKYAVADAPFSLSASIETPDLSKLVNGLLKEKRDTDEAAATANGGGENEWKNVEFDFLLDGDLVRVPLDQLVQEKRISTETVIELEYVEKYPSPKPEDSLIHDDWVAAVAGLNRYVLSGCYNNTVNIWTTEGEKLLTIPGHSGPIKSVAWVAVADGTSSFISGSHDQTLIIWALDLSQKSVERTPLLTLAGHNEGVSSLEWMEEKKVASASWDHTIKLWDVETAREEKLIQGNKVFIDISFSKLNRLIAAGSCDRHVRICDPRSQEGSIVKSSLTHHTGWVSSVAWSPTNDNLLLSGSYDAVAKLWDLRSTSAPLYNLSGHEEKILATDWTIHDPMLTGGADNHLKIFRTQQ